MLRGRAPRQRFRARPISIATNESYRQIAIRRGGMSPDRVFVVRSGPNLDRVKRVDTDPKWRNGRRFMVGYVGVISQTEGLDLLLSAVQHIVRERGRTDIHFVLVGAGPEWQQVVDLCREMDLTEYVTFTNRVDDATLFSILSTADVCVNPDRVTPYNDLSTMNKIMEYMALGKPIVQFDVTEGRFSAQDAALYAKPNDSVDFGDKIIDLVEDPALRDRMGAFGLRRVNDALAWKYEQPKLLHAYDTLFAERENQPSWWQRLGIIGRRSNSTSTPPNSRR